MGRKAGGKDFAPRVRSIVDRVLENLEDTGKAEKLLKEQFESDFAGTLRAVSAFAPKQIDVDVEKTVSIDTTELTQEVLQELFAEKAQRAGSDRAVH